MSQLVCPSCGGTEFRERDGGPDGWDDDITYTDEVCVRCGSYLHGWTDEWMDADDEPLVGQPGEETQTKGVS